MAFLALDIYQAAVQSSPARRPILNQRKKKLIAQRLSHSNNLSWCTEEVLSHTLPSIAVSCMGGLLLFLFIHFQLHKWRKYKGAHPVASRFAARGAATYRRVAGRVGRFYTRKKHLITKKTAWFKLWCMVYYYLAYSKTMKAWFRCKQKFLRPLKRQINRAMCMYCHMCQAIYRYTPTSAAVILMYLLLSGDVEQNPGPKDAGHLTTKDLATVQTSLWEVRPKWYNLGLQLDMAVDDLDVIKRTNLQNDDECLTDLLRQWLRRADPLPCWEAIVRALKLPSVNFEQLAFKIENEHLTPSSSASKTDSTKLSGSSEHLSSTHIADAQSAVVSSFQHIKEFQGLSDKQKEQLEQRLTMESENIQLRFHTLCNKFFDSLDAQHVPLKRLVRLLKGLKALKRINSSKSASVVQSYEYVLDNIADIEGVKDVIQEYSTFFDFRPVQYMIENVGLEKDRQLLEKYKEDFEHYIKRRVFECPCKVGPSDAPNSTELCVKLESDYDKLVELKQFECQLSSVLEVAVYVLRLCFVKDGCIQLAFLIPSFLQEAIFPLSKEQEAALKELGIIQLCCGSYYFSSQDQDDDDDGDDDSEFSNPSTGVGIHLLNMKGYGNLDHDSGLGTSRYKSTITDDAMEMTYDTFEDIDTSFISSNSKSLLKAAHGGKLDEVKRFIEEEGHSPYETGKFGNCSLHYAAAGGRIDVLHYLVNVQGCTHSPEGHFKQIPLHIAAQYGQLEVVKYFVTGQNVDPSNQDKFLRTPLHYACIGGNLDLVQYLINEISHYQPASISKFAQDKTKAGNTPLHFASMYGHLDIVRYFILEMKCDPYTRGKQNRTILHDAAEKGHENIVNYLINEQRCDPRVICDGGDTPLHLAAANGHLAVVRLLALDKRFDFSRFRNLHKFTAFHVAALNSHHNVLELLTHEAMWDPNVVGWRQRTPLHLAAMKGYLHDVLFLTMELYCNPLVEDKDGKTPSELAEHHGHVAIAQHLDLMWLSDKVLVGDLNSLKWFFNRFKYDQSIISDLNSGPNFRNTIKCALLHSASRAGQVHIIRYLIEEHRCDPSCLDAFGAGTTPLHCASVNGFLDAVKYLTLEKKCDPTFHCIGDNSTPIHLACSKGHLQIVKFFISDLNCDPNIPGRYNCTPLHEAVSEDHMDVIKYLVEEQNCNPSCVDIYNRTPLHYASKCGSIKAAKYLSFTSDKTCNPMLFISSNGNTPIHEASSSGHLEIVQLFISKLKCDASVLGKDNQTPLHSAAGSDHVHVVKYLIKEQKCSPSCMDKAGNTPLHYAAMTGSLEAVKYLTLEIKCDPTAYGNNIKHSPYHSAALYGQLEVFQFFLSRLNCSPNIPTEDGHTPLHLAASEGHLHIMKYLIEDQNCDPSCLDKAGNTPLHYVSVNGSLKAAKYLVLKHNCDPASYTCCDYKKASIHICASLGHLELIEFFISDLNCDPNILDEYNCTPLHAAASEGHVHIMRYLIETCGCDPSSHLDVNGNTVLHFASLSGSLEAVQYLTLERMCDPRINKNSDGNTPIHIAIVRGFLHIVKFYFSDLKCSPYILGEGNKTSLQLAATVGHLHIVKYLTEEQSHKFRWSIDHLRKTLVEAYLKGHLDIVKYLLVKLLNT